MGSILKIDLDGKNRVKGFLFRLSMLRDYWKVRHIRVEGVEVKETRKGFHIKIKLEKDLDFREILLFRLILGDDRNRATFDLYNKEVAELEEFSNILFNSKVKFRVDNEDIYETEEFYSAECILIEDMVEELIKGVGLWVE